MKLLICEPDISLGNRLQEGLKERGYDAVSVSDGREAQKRLSEEVFEVTAINIELSSFSSIEVIKFIRFRNIKTRMILMSKTQRDLDDWLSGKNNLNRLGIATSLVGAFSIDKLEASIKGFFSRQRWKNVEKSENHRETEVKAFDDQFTSIKIDEFFCGNLAIFDIYIRLAKHKYLKILNQGESMEQERLDEYKLNKGVTHLYFKTNERKIYINFLNDLVKRSTDKPIGHQVKLNFTANLTKLIAQEIYTKGLDRETIEESISVCESVHNTLESMPSLKEMFSKYLQYDDTIESHLFLTMIYSDAISKNIDWVSDHSRSKILMGALLHDIGKLKLPASLRAKKESELSGKSLIEYQKHCMYGLELLDQIPEVGEQVKQIVFQHHELNNGEGFPKGLASSKIYPPAKIVGFANRLAELSVSMQATPFAVIKKLVVDKTEINRYDPEIVKAFIKCFTDGVKK